MSIILSKCPKCGSSVEAYGTDVAPKEGISIECGNRNCDFGLFISTTIRVDGLKEEVTKEAYNCLCKLLEKQSKEISTNE